VVRHRGAYLAVAVVLILAAGWVGFRVLAGDDARAQRTTVPVPALQATTGSSEPANAPAGTTASAGPTADASGLPVGYVHTEAGARAAAVGWVSSLGALMQLGPIAATDALRALTTARVTSATIDRFRAERDQFTQQFGADPSRAIWIESPLAVDVAAFDDERAVVKVWSQLVVGVRTEATVQVLWRTQTVTLHWEDDDWRVDDVTRSEGPTPQPVAGDLPSSGSDMAEVAAWTPAVLAGSSVKGKP
jgi:hypothetical protein